jgi:hypothetical protein
MTDQVTDAAEAVVEDAPTLPEAQEAEAPTQAEEAGEAEEVVEETRPKKTAKERIDELTAARRQAERDAEYWREQAMRHAPQPTAPAPQPNDGKPDPQAYASGEFDPDYIEALTDWKASQAVRQAMSQHEQQVTIRQQVQGFEQRLAQQFPEGEPAGISALRRAPVLPEAMQEIILTSESGPKLADYLGSNPHEFARLSSLTPAKQAYELARLESRLSAPPPKQTGAPAPAPTLRGVGGKFAPAPDTNDFTAFEKLADSVLSK